MWLSGRQVCSVLRYIWEGCWLPGDVLMSRVHRVWGLLCSIPQTHLSIWSPPSSPSGSVPSPSLPLSPFSSLRLMMAFYDSNYYFVLMTHKSVGNSALLSILGYLLVGKILWLTDCKSQSEFATLLGRIPLLLPTDGRSHTVLPFTPEQP